MSDTKSKLPIPRIAQAIPEETLAFFQSQPWTKSLLESPKYIPSFIDSRYVKSTTEDAFFAQTLATPSTIPQALTLILRDLPVPPTQATLSNTTSSLSLPVPQEPDCVWLMALSSPGISGHPYTAHGGVLAAIMDEILGHTVGLQRRHNPDRGPNYTARLDTHYKAPIKVPGVYVGIGWITGQKGRKLYARGQLRDKDGKLYTEAEGIWVESPRGHL
ncbi:MAG: hypothetical protein Q9227_006038 [Pyrenula ochraceoflavens]